MRISELMEGKYNPKIINDQIKKTIVDLYTSGKSSYQIADQTGVSATSIQRFLKQFPELLAQHKAALQSLGINPERGKKRGTTPEEVWEMGRLFAQGWTTGQIGSKYGIKSNSVLKQIKRLPNWEELFRSHNEILKSQGKHIPTGHVGLTKDHIDQMIEMFVSGMTMEKIGQQFNVSGNAVKSHIKKIGNLNPEYLEKLIKLRSDNKAQKRKYPARRTVRASEVPSSGRGLKAWRKGGPLVK